AQESRVLLLHHQQSGIDVDLSLGQLPFEEEMIARSVAVDVSGLSISLPTPEDFIIMKAIAHRPRHMADIEAVLDVHRKLNLGRIRRWARDFAGTPTPGEEGQEEEITPFWFCGVSRRLSTRASAA